MSRRVPIVLAFLAAFVLLAGAASAEGAGDADTGRHDAARAILTPALWSQPRHLVPLVSLPFPDAAGVTAYMPVRADVARDGRPARR